VTLIVVLAFALAGGLLQGLLTADWLYANNDSHERFKRSNPACALVRRRER
jgi:hypothetical protein